MFPAEQAVLCWIVSCGKHLLKLEHCHVTTPFLQRVEMSGGYGVVMDGTKTPMPGAVSSQRRMMTCFMTTGSTGLSMWFVFTRPIC